MDDPFNGLFKEMDRINRMLTSNGVADVIRQIQDAKPIIDFATLDAALRVDLTQQFNPLLQPTLLGSAHNDLAKITTPDIYTLSQGMSPEIHRALSENLGQVSPTLADQVQASFAALDASFRLNQDLLSPFLHAEAEWLRLARLPSTAIDWHDVKGAASDLAANITAWLAAPSREATKIYDEREVEALQLAEERFEQILDEKRVRPLLHALRDFVEHFAATLPHAAKKFLLLLVLHLLVQIIASPFESMLHRHAEQHTVVKEIRQEAKKCQRAIQSRFPASAYVVISPRLIVYQQPSRRAHQVGRLYAGDIVYFERSRTRSWSLVERASGDSAIRGWVFSRYVRRISNGRWLPRAPEEE